MCMLLMQIHTNVRHRPTSKLEHLVQPYVFFYTGQKYALVCPIKAAYIHVSAGRTVQKRGDCECSVHAL